MPSAFYAFLAVVPLVTLTLLLRFLIHMEGWSVGLVGAFSRMVTVPLLAAWALGTGAGWRRLRPRGMGRWLTLMGVISIVIHLLWFGSAKWTTATNISMLFRFDVVFVVLLGALLGLERIGAWQLALLPILFVGLALLTEIDKFDWSGHMLGDAMVVVAAFGYAANAFIIRHILQVMDEAAVALYNHSISTLGFVALGVAGNDFVRWRQVFEEPVVWQSIMWLGVVGAVGLPLYYVALRRMSVWRLRMFMLAGPVLTAMVEWPLWGARLSSLQCFGALIILGGLAVLIYIEWHETNHSDRPGERPARSPSVL